MRDKEYVRPAGQTAALAAAFATDDGGDLGDEASPCVAQELVAVLDGDDLEAIEGPAEEVLDADLDDLGDDDDDQPPAFPDADYVASLGAALVGDPVPLDAGPAACVAEGWSAALGAGFFQDILLIEPAQLAVLDDLAQVSFINSDAELLADAAAACQVPVQQLLLAMLDTAPLGPEQVACFVAGIPDPALAELAIAPVLTRGELPPADDPAGMAIVGALGSCGIAG